MACINMFNAEHQGLYGGGGGAAAPPPMSPRISFSNDFVLDAATGCPTVRYERTSAASTSSWDFEFSVEESIVNGMMTADELFFKGRLLPLREHYYSQMQRMTLRDELLVPADDVNDDHGPTFPPSSRLPAGKVSLRWKTLLGLRAKARHPPTGKKQNCKKQTTQLHDQELEADQEEEAAAAPCNINTSTPDQQDDRDHEGETDDVEIRL